ncbi:PKD domain-containing protein [Thermus tenuipuniceus]|uniref:PKD domain-containing protein n=1 Tax=Thermus tenuipuniceus TaxID=2078690 RepID=UPI001FCA0CA4|nr:PKD domain-containing protein [Thermus tenuipuniceus]
MARIASLLVLALVLLAACNEASPNRPPQLTAFQADPLEGEAPLTVRFAWQAVDPDGDPLSCVLEPGDGASLAFAPCGSGTTYTYSAPGEYSARLRVQDPKGATAQSPVTVRVRPSKSFTLSLSPTSLSVEQGKTGTATLTLTPQGGFSGTVSLSLVGAPSGVNLSPGSLPVNGSSPVSQALTLRVGSAVPTGTYPLKVRATGGGLTREADLTLTVAPPTDGDFSLTLEGSSLSVNQGGTVYVRLVVSGTYTGQVTLSLVDAVKNPFSGVSLSPTSTSVPSAPMLALTASPTLAPGTYNLFVRGQGGGLVREASLTLTINPAAPPPDFSLSLNPASLSLSQGQNGTTTLTLTPQNGFTGQVALSLERQDGTPAPSSLTLSPTSLNVASPNPVSQTLTLSVASSVPTGTYPLRVRATSGSLSRTTNLSLTVTAPSSSPNLRFAQTEWGQTVLKENLRLVAGKPALLRVHLLASPSPIPLSNALSGAVYLNATFQGNLSFACPNPIPTATDPGSLASTCTATLPAAWVAPGLKVELRADPQDQVAEHDEGDNLLTLTPEVGAGTTLYLTTVPVVHQGQTATVPNFSQTLWRIWPLKEVAFSQRAPYTFSGTLSATDGNTWAQLLDELRILRQTDGSNRYYYGFVRVSYTSGIAGIGYLGYPVAVGWDYSQSAPAVMAHELGHNFDREHAPCGVSGDPSYPYAGGKIGTWGYDLANGSLKDPSQFYDLMSYCGPQWVSDYTYEGAQGFLETSPPKPLSLPEEGLLFSGRIRQGEVVFNPPLRVPAEPEGKASPYHLRAQTPSGEVREAPVFVLKDSEGILHFQARLPPEPYSRVGLYLGAQLLREAVSPLLPLAEPQVDLREEGGFLLARVQGYPYFSLFHVAEDGSRTTLGLWHRAGEVPFALEGLPPGGQWEVQLSDGLGVRILRFSR